MQSRTTTLLTALIGAVCVWFFVHFASHPRRVRNDVVQGILIGWGMAFLTAQILARMTATRINGWITMYGLGDPRNGMFVRAAHALAFPGPVNAAEESMYWRTSCDGEGRALNGRHDYTMQFPPGGLPPNSAFWSLTMGDAMNRFVPNPINRWAVSDHSGLVPNGDGSVDIYIQHGAPAGHESNWLPAPKGHFTLWLRVYLPGQAILDGTYDVPAVVRAR